MEKNLKNFNFTKVLIIKIPWKFYFNFNSIIYFEALISNEFKKNMMNYVFIQKFTAMLKWSLHDNNFDFVFDDSMT
jgi:hypothetical protein